MYAATAFFRALILVILAVPGGTSAAIAQSCEPQWDTDFAVPGMNSPVNALLISGSTNERFVYAAGRFTSAGGAPAAKIARWDGSSWSSLGSGIGGVGPVVHALSASVPSLGGTLFAGGQFTTAGGTPVSNLVRWGDGTWDALGEGVNGPVFALAVHDDGSGPALFVGGAFTQAGGVPASNIAKWDGTQWFGLGSGTDGRVFSMTVFDDGDGERLYVGGEFTMVGALTAQRVARWNGPGWSDVGGGFNDSVFALSTFDDPASPDGPELYAGGRFTQNGGTPVSRIARWDGSSWKGLGSGVNATVRALVAFDDGGGAGLYVGGSFTSAGGGGANRIARWNGAAWTPLGVGLNDSVFALAIDQDLSRVGPALYVGGSLAQAGGMNANFVVRWTGCVDLPGDMNSDGRLDAADVGPFVGCLTGPGGGTMPGCTEADADTDNDVDIADFSALSNFFTGS